MSAITGFRIRVATVTIAGVLTLGSTAVAAQDAIEAAADFYETVLENDQVRVLRATYPPGARSAMHNHPPSVVIQVSGGSLRFTGAAGQMIEQVLPEGRVAFSGGPHAVENIGAEDIVVLIVELKGQTPPSLLERIFGQ